MYINVIDLL